MAQISIISGKPLNAIYELAEKNIIGRLSSNTIALDDSKSSRQNSVIVKQQDTYFIKDLGSRNGTIVNGENIRDKRQLFSGDRIKIGNTIFLFVEDDDPGATADISKYKEELKSLASPPPKKVVTDSVATVKAAESPLQKGTPEASLASKKVMADSVATAKATESPLQKGIREASLASKKKSRYRSSVEMRTRKKSSLNIDFSQLDSTNKIYVIAGFIFFMLVLILVSRWLTLAFIS